MAAQQVANPALAALQDIQTPTAIGAWPLAYGYWIVIIIAVVILLAAFVYFNKRYKNNAAKRAALVALAELKLSAPNYITQTNEILKRAAMSYCDRDIVAGLSGSAWHAWLSAQVKRPPVELCDHLKLGYQPIKLTESQALILKQSAEHWLKSALPLTKQQSTAVPQRNMEAK